METVKYLNELDALIQLDKNYIIRGKKVDAYTAIDFIQIARMKGLSDVNIAKLITVSITDRDVKLINLINNATTNNFQSYYRRA